MMQDFNSENMVSAENNGAGGQLEVISYLAQMGLGDSDLAKVASLLQTIRGHSLPQPVTGEDLQRAMVAEELIKTMQGENLLLEPRPSRQHTDTARPVSPESPASTKAIKLYLVEEQQVMREAYQKFLRTQPNIQLLNSPGDTFPDDFAAAVTALEPDVVLFGVKVLQATTVETLVNLRKVWPHGATVLMFALLEAKGIQALREYSKDAVSGYAYLLKHKFDTTEQLAQVISSVAEGRVIVDPEVMVELVEADEGHQYILRDLSQRELEVLSWMAKAYANSTIASLMGLDISVVERHVKSIYRKLNDDHPDISSEPEDRRVRAALLYLKATGLLIQEPIPQL